MITDIFDCAAYLRFSQPAYTFAEEDGTGSVMVEGTPGFEAVVVGGPDPNMADVRISGTVVTELITGPATVTFDINDDEVSVEVDETYPLTLLPNDTAVIVMERMTSIIITDDVDRMKMGFESLNYIRFEGNETGVRVRVNGENVRDYFFFYIQERAPPASDIQLMLTVMFGIYSEADVIFPPIINPDDEIALQDDRIYRLGLVILPEFVDDVELGAMIGSDQTFSMSNLTRRDNDVVTVSFDEPSYTVLESGSVDITLSLDRGIATAFSVVVRPEPTIQPPGLEPSIPTVTYTVNFAVSDSLQSRTFTLTPVDDNVPNEPNEVINLVFASISDPRVEQGDPAEVIIVDDDILADIGFAVPSYTFIENEGTGSVVVNGPENFPSTLSVRIMGGPGTQPPTVRISGTDVDEMLTSFPATVTFDINDDDAALEDIEMYTLVLIPSDPSITISQNTSRIFILDDDEIIVGFPYEEMTFEASDVGNATMHVFGEALQSFTVNYVQELGGTTELTFPAGDYPIGFTMSLPLTFPRVSGPQNYFFMIALVPATDGVTAGGVIGEQPVFPIANITIVDDAIIVGFQSPEYTFLESTPGGAPVFVIKSATVDDFFTVDVSANVPPNPPFVFQSAFEDLLAGTVLFSSGSEAPDIESYDLDIQDDVVAVEDNEVFTLSLGGQSDSRVQIGGTVGGVVYHATTTVTILDDDLARVGFVTTSYVFPEDRPQQNIDVRLFNDIVTGRSVTVQLVEQNRGDLQFVEQSFVLPSNSLTFTVAAIMSVFPEYNDDVIGVEDPESLDLVIEAVSDPSGITIDPAVANVNVLDDEVVVIQIDPPLTRTISEGESTDVCVSKNLASTRPVNFSLTSMDGTAGGQDYFPTSVVLGSLPEDAISTPECFPYSGTPDSISEGDEVFSVVLDSANNIMMSGTGAINVGDDTVTITIRDEITPPPGPEVEDTVIGDPLFTVPIPDFDHLCYEIRGAADRYFNFISDSCVSVNAHYVERTMAGETKVLHVVDEIAIRAVNNLGNCVNILVERNGCTITIDDVILDSDSYSVGGITVTRVGKRITVIVPNCDDQDLEMEIICENMNGLDMLRFEVMRGLNLRETSHGLLGQFWNVEISVQDYTGSFRNGATINNLVLVTLTPSDRDPRTFPAWREQKTWDNRMSCLYAGNQNGGTVFETVDAHDSLIEGEYKNYITGGPFSTVFTFTQFDETRCSI
jgi:hypothetical protein